jgi:hypothetical protein
MKGTMPQAAAAAVRRLFIDRCASIGPVTGTILFWGPGARFIPLLLKEISVKGS